MRFKCGVFIVVAPKGSMSPYPRLSAKTKMMLGGRDWVGVSAGLEQAERITARDKKRGMEKAFILVRVLVATNPVSRNQESERERGF